MGLRDMNKLKQTNLFELKERMSYYDIVISKKINKMSKDILMSLFGIGATEVSKDSIGMNDLVVTVKGHLEVENSETDLINPESEITIYRLK